MLRFRLLALLLIVVGSTSCDKWVTTPIPYNVIQVRTHLQDGSPVSGVPLILYTGQRAMGFASTGSNGVYRFERVPEGNYGVYALPSPEYGFVNELTGPRIDYVDRIGIGVDSTVYIDFVLYRH